MASDEPVTEVWVLGATGRVGRAVAAALAEGAVRPVLVGRDAGRLRDVAARAGDRAETLVAGSPAEVAAAVGRRAPGVVVNTIGPFAATAPPIARACLAAGSDYLDLANDLAAFDGLLGMHAEAAAACRTLVTGVGFGVLATEAVVARLCEGAPVPRSVRVDALASVGSEAGVVGSALAATIVDVLVTGGRRYRDGRLVRARLGGDVQDLVLPDGGTATSAGVPSGELVAARLASAAPAVTATSALAPTAPAVRALLPLAAALMTLPALRSLATRQLAGARVPARRRPREHSWGHAVVTWPDGTTREGWLRTGDGMDFTVAVVVEAVLRLSRGIGRPGAYTPAAAFGADIATAAGGEFVLDGA